MADERDDDNFLCGEHSGAGSSDPGLMGGTPGMEAVFGPNTPARRILVCIYAAIWGLSVAGLVLILTGRADMALSLALGLFSVQIVYKGLTVLAVGLGNPVVVTNLAIAGLHCVTLGMILTRS